MTGTHHCVSRRTLLAAVGATALTACASVPQPAALTPGAIDVHHHLVSPRLLQRHADQIPGGGTARDWTPAKSLEAMDKANVKTVVVSFTGGFLPGDIPESRAMCRDLNDFAAQIKTDHAGRFGSFAVIPAPDTEGALAEIAYALDTLKAEGIALATNYGGKYLGDASFKPVMEELNRRAAVVYVHPILNACCAGLVSGLPPFAIEFPFDTTRTIASLLYSGTLLNCPNIKFIFSHGGGALGQLADRMGDFGAQRVAPDGPMALYKKLFVDTASIENPSAMAATRTLLPQSQILLGTDFPYLDMVRGRTRLRTLNLPSAGLAQIERGNAARLMPALLR